MRNYITYLLTALFLFFVVESRINVKILQHDDNTHTSHNLSKKVSRLNRTYEKQTIRQAPDDTVNSYSLELTEDDFRFSDTLQAVVAFAGIFGLAYIFGLKGFKKLKPYSDGFLSGFSSVKKFILIRSIRI